MYRCTGVPMYREECYFFRSKQNLFLTLVCTTQHIFFFDPSPIGKKLKELGRNKSRCSCLYARWRECVRVRTWARTSYCKHARAYSFARMCTHVHACVMKRAHMCAHVKKKLKKKRSPVWSYVCAYLRTYLLTYIRTYVRTYVLTYLLLIASENNQKKNLVVGHSIGKR